MSATKPALVYAPGIDGTGRLLFRQARLHAEYDVRCVAYPQDRTHTYADLAALVERELERASGGVLLAESFGGAVALMVALARPDLVSRLVLVNTFAYFPRRAYIRVLTLAGPFLPAKPSHPIARPVRSALFFGREVPTDVRRQWWDLTADVPMSAFGRRFQLITNLDLRPRLVQVRMPTVVFVAPDDHIVPPVAGLTLARRIPGAKLIQHRAGHAAMVHPAVDVAEILERLG